MKKTFLVHGLIALLFSFSSFALSAQEDKAEDTKFDREAFQAKRNAYIIAEVGFTADEAEVFIPLENELRNKLFEIGRECRKMAKECKSVKTLSDQKYSQIVDCKQEARFKEAEVEKEYYDKFKKILTPEKLYKYQQADAKFMREFMQGRKRGLDRQQK